MIDDISTYRASRRSACRSSRRARELGAHRARGRRPRRAACCAAQASRSSVDVPPDLPPMVVDAHAHPPGAAQPAQQRHSLHRRAARSASAPGGTRARSRSPWRTPASASPPTISPPSSRVQPGEGADHQRSRRRRAGAGGVQAVRAAARRPHRRGERGRQRQHLPLPPAAAGVVAGRARACPTTRRRAGWPPCRPTGWGRHCWCSLRTRRRHRWSPVG